MICDRYLRGQGKYNDFSKNHDGDFGPADRRPGGGVLCELENPDQLRTVKAFVEGAVFADAVAACEKAPSSTPFKWNGGKQTAVIGLNSVKLNKDTIIASYTLVADSVYCDYDPVKKKADIGSNFLERELF